MTHATLIKLNRRQPPAPLHFPDRSEDLAAQQPALDDDPSPPLLFSSKKLHAPLSVFIDNDNSVILAYFYLDPDEPLFPAVTAFPINQSVPQLYALASPDELSFIYFDFHEPFVPAVTSFSAPSPQVIIHSPDELSFIYFDFHEPLFPTATTFTTPPPQVTIYSPEELFYVSADFHEPFVPAITAFVVPFPQIVIHSPDELFYATLPIEVDEPFVPAFTRFSAPAPRFTDIFDEPLDLTGLAYFLLEEPELRTYIPVTLSVLRPSLWEEELLTVSAAATLSEDEPAYLPRALYQPPNRYVQLVIAITLDPDFGGYHNATDEGFVLDQPNIEW